MGKIIHKIITLIDLILTYPIYLLSFLVPRNKNIWIFIGWHLNEKRREIFADNTKYLFLYTSQNEKNIKAIYLTKDKNLAQKLNKLGYKSYYEKNFKGIYYALRAKYTIIDAYLKRYNFRYTGGSKIIQLLHGKGMKKSGYSKKQIKNNYYIFNTSEFTMNLLPKIFTQKSKKIIKGYPRDDIFFSKIKDYKLGVNKKTYNELDYFKNHTKKKNLLYAPTFRRGQKKFNLNKILDLKNMSKILEKNNLHLFISLHPKYRNQTLEINFDNISFIEGGDITPLLLFFDLLITDYSSIFTDFLLLNKPLIFYPYDLEDYKKNEGIIFDYKQYTPGPKVFNTEELINGIKKYFIDKQDNYIEKRKKIKKLYHKYEDGKSSKRIIEYLLKKENIN